MKHSATAIVLSIAATLGSNTPALSADWPSYNGDPQSSRFSPLTQISLENAADLREVCEVNVGDEGSFQPGPVMVGDTLYITTMHTVVAVDAAHCTVRWRYVYKLQEDEVLPGNRGVAYMNGKLFRGTTDGRILALDAATGREIWQIKAAEPSKYEFFSAAPIAWNGLVYLGPGGADYAIRGRMTAFDAATGKEAWRFNIIPQKGEPGYETWTIPETAEHGGGGTWSSYTLDPATGEFFMSVANPAPGYSPTQRPGDNLYTESLVVLDARSGKLKWYHQFISNDGYDYDLVAAPMLFTTKSGRRRIAIGGKDGYLYILDRDTHKLLSKTAVTTIKPGATPPTPEGVHACPGTTGGVEWNGPAYSPETHLVYVGAVDWCGYFTSNPRPFVGSAKYDPSRTGWIYAIDGATGKTQWRYHASSPVLAGVTATAGDVVFSGDSAGNLLMFNAINGGGVITYEVAGKQYVATTAGNVSRSGLATGVSSNPRLIVLATGLPQDYQAVKINAVPPHETGRPFGLDQGKAVYTAYCGGCHGPRGMGGESGPPLTNEASRKDLAALKAWISNPLPPMPKLSPPMTDSEVDQVAGYVMTLK
jgi:alcohol dehydrogenase (cytochrome c)